MARRQRELPAEPDEASVERPVTPLPAGYPELLEELRARIRTTQIKAALSANRELVALYWHIGRSIVERQRTEGWGRSVVDRLSADLQREFPGVAGFSANNIWRMRAFYLAWTEGVLSQRASESSDAILAQAVQESGGAILAQPVQEPGETTLPQAAAESADAILTQPVSEFGPQDVPPEAAEIPWGHNVVLWQKVKDRDQRLWYARQTVANGWQAHRARAPRPYRNVPKSCGPTTTPWNVGYCGALTTEAGTWAPRQARRAD